MGKGFLSFKKNPHLYLYGLDSSLASKCWTDPYHMLSKDVSKHVFYCCLKEALDG